MKYLENCEKSQCEASNFPDLRFNKSLISDLIGILHMHVAETAHIRLIKPALL